MRRGEALIGNTWSRGPQPGAAENVPTNTELVRGLVLQSYTVKAITGATFLLRRTLDTSCSRSVTEGKHSPSPATKQPTRIYRVLVITTIMNI